MKVGVLGSGDVAKTLAAGFIKHGHEVVIGSRTPTKLDEWVSHNPKARAGTFGDAARFGDFVVLAVGGTVAAEVLRLIGASNLSGKVVMDVTNPIEEKPPVNGVLSFFTKQNESLMELLQAEFAGAKFVKAFNSVGFGLMINPKFGNQKPTMFICGNDDAAKKTVSTIVEQFGWEPYDMGKVEAARALEGLCILWCIPAFAQKQRNHAFKLLKKN